MPTVTHSTAFSPEELTRILTPRSDVLLAERAVDEQSGEFELEAGPFSYWRRSITSDDESIHQTIEYSSAVPHWGWAINLLLRRTVQHGIKEGSVPWWSPATRVSVPDVTVLGLCATLSLVAGFLGGLIGQNLTFIAEDFGASTGDQSAILAIIRIGAIFTAIATALADKRGRRPLMMYSFVIAGFAAMLTAAAPSIEVVTGLQMVTRGLIAAAALLIPVVCAEQIPAPTRAYATAIMAAAGGLGVGMVLWILPLVDVAPWGWRLMFLAAAPALFVAYRALRRLPESQRFERELALPPKVNVRIKRLALLALSLYLLNVFAAPVQQLQNDYLRSERGFDGTNVAVFLLLTNTWGGLGLLAGSQLADRRSRRIAASLGMIGLAVGNAVMFNFAGVPMWVGSFIGSVIGAATVPAIGTMLPELFPTLRRGIVNGGLNGTAVLGSISGLLIARHFIEDATYGPTMSVLAIAPILVAILVWWLPETASRELDDLNTSEPESFSPGPSAREKRS